jgi:hypothetical protein
MFFWIIPFCYTNINNPDKYATRTAILIEDTPTISPFSAEGANSGIHQYMMTPHENGCEASDDSSSPTTREKEHIFTSDFSMVTYGGREYFQVGEHRYQSINESEKPLILEYSEEGFVLNVYNEGDDPNFNEPCLYFNFVFQE